MRTTKTLVSISFILFSFIYSHAQQDNPRVVLSIGNGYTQQLNSHQDAAGIGASTTYGVDVVVPLWAKKSGTFFQTSLGMEVSASYLKNNRSYGDISVSTLSVAGQSTSPVLHIDGADKSKSSGYAVALGPQFNISAGHFTLSPAVAVGYMQWLQNQLSIEQTATINGQSTTYLLEDRKKTTSSGISISPKAKIAYRFCGMGIWMEGAYTRGPEVKSETTYFMPQGRPSATDGMYKPDQITNGTLKTLTNATVYNTIGVSGGVSFYINGVDKKKKKEKPYTGRDDNCDGLITAPGNNGNTVSVLLDGDDLLIKLSDGSGYVVSTTNEKIQTVSAAELTRQLTESCAANKLRKGGQTVQSITILNTKTGKKRKITTPSLDNDCDFAINDTDGDYEIDITTQQKGIQSTDKPLESVIHIELAKIDNRLKTKHDTAKNSVGNIR